MNICIAGLNRRAGYATELTCSSTLFLLVSDLDMINGQCPLINDWVRVSYALLHDVYCHHTVLSLY